MELLCKCPHHDLSRWLQIQTFYNGLSGGAHLNVDATVGGSL